MAEPLNIVPYNKKRTENRKFSVLFVVGGDKRDRTADLLNAIQALSRADGETPSIYK